MTASLETLTYRNIRGSTSVFAPQLTQTTITCYLGIGLTGTVIGTVPVDAVGGFALIAVGPVPPNPGTFTRTSAAVSRRPGTAERRARTLALMDVKARGVPWRR